jgi:hypothetical protein
MRPYSSRRRLLASALPLLVGLAVAPTARTVAAQVDEPVSPGDSQLARETDVRLLSPSFRLVVPFRTQKDGGRWQTSNCGPATLGMLLDGYGIEGQATDDLRFRMHTYQGTVGWRTGTALENVARVAEDFAVRTHGLFQPDGSFRSWQVSDVVTELRLGRPVMLLVRLYLVPGYEAMGSRWGHYILLTGITPEGFVFSDSLKTEPLAGTSGLISERQLAAAMGNSHIPGQAVAYAGPRDLPILTS